jgi:hypothetical protein
MLLNENLPLPMIQEVNSAVVYGAYGKHLPFNIRLSHVRRQWNSWNQLAIATMAF